MIRCIVNNLRLCRRVVCLCARVKSCFQCSGIKLSGKHIPVLCEVLPDEIAQALGRSTGWGMSYSAPDIPVAYVPFRQKATQL